MRVRLIPFTLAVVFFVVLGFILVNVVKLQKVNEIQSQVKSVFQGGSSESSQTQYSDAVLEVCG
jgi:hypothetical protein